MRKFFNSFGNITAIFIFLFISLQVSAGLISFAFWKKNAKPPSNTIAPSVSGTTQEAQTLSCATGTWTGTAPITYAYQWKRDGVNVGSNSSWYTLVSGDVGHKISCVVTGSNAQGSVAGTSNTTGTITLATGQQLFNAASSGVQQYWYCPAGVTSISVVVIGAGSSGFQGTTGAAGGAGGALAYANNFSVTPGATYEVRVGRGFYGMSDTTPYPGETSSFGWRVHIDAGNSYYYEALIASGGGQCSGPIGGGCSSGIIRTGGGNGGNSVWAGTYNEDNGGGGAGGYSGNGGKGGGHGEPSTAGSGGGGGGGGGSTLSNSVVGTGGGGTGVYGEGPSGAAGSVNNGGGGGSGGSAGSNALVYPNATGNGGNYGGGGGGARYMCAYGWNSVLGVYNPAPQNFNYGKGGDGAVRIIWPGTTRQFPLTNTGDM